MSVPEHLWRYPTAAAIESLARRFDLPNEPNMLDWEFEVANPKRIDEFLEVYEHGALDEDERFTLMQMIIQSFEELEAELTVEPRWTRTLELIERNIQLHIYSVWYWASLDVEDANERWRVAPSMLKLQKRYQREFVSA